MNAAVEVSSVRKKFCRNIKRGMVYTATDVARDLVGMKAQSDTLRPSEFWALQGVDLELRQGECFGLIGSNGSGKSTLLKLINGIIRPDNGQIRIRGRVGALIEVGAGFHPMLTGRENVYVNGAILGMTRREVDRKFDEIIAFSGLDGAALEMPVKSYSSGMYVRLGFAVAVHTEPDVLLIDEVLAVGDIRFMGQCRQKIAELRRNGTSMILVSHSLGLIEETCERAMLLIKGECLSVGSAKAVTAAYRKHASQTASGFESRETGNGSLRFLSGTMVNAEGRETDTLTCGETATLEILLSTIGEITEGYFCVWVIREDEDQMTGVGYLQVGRDLPAFSGGTLRLRFRCQLMPGGYRLGVTFSRDGRYELIDQFEPCGFTVEPRPNNPFAASGVFELDLKAETVATVS